ncbi:MAG: helix-turn-helix domain-containing protein [Phycisphaeraceae bacterium]|nr:helix-turn-helix domain-containing protein [Phycisphaeraceae bacterium]
MASESDPASGTSDSLGVGGDPDRLLSFKEACEFLGIGERLAWSLCNRRELPGIRIGRLWRFRRSALVAWVAAREKRGGRP